MSLASQIESVQPDVYYKLLTESWFENIAIFQIREKRLDTEVNRALAGLAGNNSKGGASIEVLMPSLKTALPETAGPVCTLEQRFIVKEQPTVNQGANGTGLSVEQIAVNIAQTFQLFYLGGPMQGFYAAPEFYKYQAMPDEAAFIAVAVTLHATFALTALARTSAPTASAAAETVTLIDQQPGGGSTLYYTTDGSFPGSGNPSAMQYTTPFTVASGTVVRAAAYNGTLQGSMVDTFVVT
jgi:Fn3 associated